LPRHTHPAQQAKHARAHTREQRRRHIDRRLRRAKRDGTLDHLHLHPKFGRLRAMPSSEYHERRERIQQQLDQLGFGDHPDVLRHLTVELRRETSGLPLPAGALGALADRDCFWGRRSDGHRCVACAPYRAGVGYRTRVNRRYLDDMQQALDDWRDDEDLTGRLISANTQPHAGGWC